MNQSDWLNSKFIDEEDKDIIKKMTADQIKENFSKTVSFGTGGIRAKMGLGTSKLNKYIIRKVSQGLANYLLKNYENPSAIITRDARINSLLFQDEAAKVLSSNGIKVYIFEEVHSTPELTYAIRKLKTSCGISITASHNSKEYNGYKVYLDDGGQVVSPYVDDIIEEINKVTFDDIKYKNTDLVEVLDDSLDTMYINDIKALTLKRGDLNVLYSALHGTAGRPVLRALKELGYNVKTCDTQIKPDGNFPTIAYANPEVKESFDESLKYLTEDIDIMLNNDPDADRVGVAVLKNGKVHYLSGNETGMLVLDYILKTKDTKGKNLVATTIVSTPMIENVKGIKLMKTLTGFKYVGEIIKHHEDEFLYAFEESFGFLYGTNTRDKDGILGALIVCEMASYYKSKNSDLVTQLERVYKEYGPYYSETINLKYSENDNVMEKFRALDIPKIDYKLDDTGLRKSDVLEFNLEDKTRILIRPSGTEPKLKIYIHAKSKELIDKYKLKLTKML